MANVLSLAMKVSADASSVPKQLTPVDRALASLGKQAEKATSVLDKFAAGSAAAAAAQAKAAGDFEKLAQALRDGLDPQEYARRFAALTQAAQDTANAFAEGARITESNRTAEERRAAQLQRLKELLDLNAVSAQAYAREAVKLSAGIDTTPQQRFSEAVSALQQQLQSGSLTFQEFASEAKQIGDAIAASTPQSQIAAQAILSLKQQFDAGVISVQQYREEFARIQSGDVQTTLRVEVLGVREGVEATDQLKATIASLTSTQIEAAVKVSGQENLDALRSQLDGIDGRQIDTLLKVLGVESIDAARERLARLDGTTVQASLRTIGFESIDAARAALTSLQDRSVTATLEFLGVDTIEAARARLDTLDGTTIEALLKASGFESIDAAKAKLSELQNVNVAATLSLLGVDSIDAARAKLATLDASDITVEAQLQTAGFESIDKARALLDTLQDKNVTATAKALGVDSVERLIEVVNGVESKTVEVATSTNADDTAKKLNDLVAEQDAFNKLLEEGNRATESVAQAFARFGNESTAAAAAQEKFDVRLRALIESLKSGMTSPEDFARSLQQLQAAATQTASDLDSASRIVEANLTRQERAQRDYDNAIAEAIRLRKTQVLDEENYNREINRAADAFAKATVEANKFAKASATAGDGGTLKFNELSGVLSALPGPIGNVAGRLSGLASAGEGLGRVFAAGLTPGISSIGTALVGLVNPFTAAVAGFAALGVAATSVVSGLSSLEAETERLQNAADKLGVSFGFMQTLQKAAEMSGVSFESVNGAMTRLLKTLAGADEESKQATAALDRLGVSLDDLNGKNSEEQLKLIGERLQGIEDPAKRAAAATAIFGKSGAELLPFFQNLGIAEQTLTRFNARLSDLDVGRVLALGDSFDAVKASLSGVGNELLTPFIGVTQSLSDGLASAIATFGRNIGAVLDIFSPLTSAVGAAGNLFLQFGSILGNIVGTVLEPFAAVGRLVSGAIDGISQAVTAVAGRVNDAVVGFREFFKFEPLAAQLRDALSQVSAAFQQVLDVAGRVATIIGTALSQLGSAIGSTFGSVIETLGQGVSSFLEFVGIGDTISAFTSSISQAFGSLWEGIKAVVGQVGGFIEQVLQFAEDWLGIKREVEQPVVATVELQGGGAIQDLIAENKEFQKTLDDITSGVNKAINESAKFGDAGFDAALKYQESIAKLKQQLDAGLFNEETFRREAEKAGVAFKEELARIEEDAKLEIQINADAEKTLAGLNAEVDKAIKKAGEFGQQGFDAANQFQTKIDELRRQFEAGIINDEALKQGVAAVNAEYDKQIDKIKQVQDEQKKLIADQDARVDALLQSQSETAKIEQQILDVQQTAARVADEAAKAREAGNAAAADGAAARLGQLEQLEAQLEEKLQAAEQGFGEAGFGPAFKAINDGLNDSAAKAAEFGNAGAQAFAQLKAGVEQAQQQAKDGVLNKEALDQQIAAQQKAFDQEIKNIEAAAKRREDVQKQVDQMIFDSLDKQQQAQIKAAENIKVLEEEKAEVQRKLQAARDAGDKEAIKAGNQRLAQIDQLAAKERDVASGAAGQREKFLEQQKKVAEAQQKQQEALLQQQQKAAEERQKAEEAEYNRQVQRITALNTLGSRTVETADVRTQAGQQIVLDLLNQEQDPALIQARLQTKTLQQIYRAVQQATTNAPVPVSI